MGRATPTPSPSKVPSFRYSSRTRFRTGECSAAQSIFLCPSGARDGSLTRDSLCMMVLLLAGARVAGVLFGGLYLLAPAEHEAADDDQGEEGKQDQAEGQSRRGRREARGGDSLVVEAEAEDEAHDQAAEAPDPHEDVAQPRGAGGRHLVGEHDLGPQQAPSLDPRVQNQQQDGPEHEAHDGVIDRDDRAQGREGDETYKVVEPGDPDRANHRGDDGHGRVDRELLARVHVRLHVLPAPEERAPQLVRQETEEEVADEAEDAPYPQGPEEVPDKVPYGRPPGARRAEEQPEDEREDVGRPDLGKARDNREPLERNENRRVDRGAQRHQHDHLRVPPHRKDLFHGPPCGRTAVSYRLSAISSLCRGPAPRRPLVRIISFGRAEYHTLAES